MGVLVGAGVFVSVTGTGVAVGATDVAVTDGVMGAGVTVRVAALVGGLGGRKVGELWGVPVDVA